MEWEPVPFEGGRPPVPFLTRQVSFPATTLQMVFDLAVGILLPLVLLSADECVFKLTPTHVEGVLLESHRPPSLRNRERATLEVFRAPVYIAMAGTWLLLAITFIVPEWSRISARIAGYSLAFSVLVKLLVLSLFLAAGVMRRYDGVLLMLASFVPLFVGAVFVRNSIRLLRI